MDEPTIMIIMIEKDEGRRYSFRHVTAETTVDPVSIF